MNVGRKGRREGGRMGELFVLCYSLDKVHRCEKDALANLHGRMTLLYC